MTHWLQLAALVGDDVHDDIDNVVDYDNNDDGDADDHDGETQG